METWTKLGVESVQVDVDENGRVDLSRVLDDLGKRGVIQLLVEGNYLWFLYLNNLGCAWIYIPYSGGGEIHSEFLKNNFVDELHLFYGACVSYLCLTHHNNP